MAWHRIGNTTYSDRELEAKQVAETVGNLDFLVPAAVTALGVYLLITFVGVLPFFVIHSTTAKLLYIFGGITLFLLGYAFRKLIVGLIAFAIGCAVLLIAGSAAWHWLAA